MSPALPALLPRPLLVAHRGAAGHEEPDTADAFRLALRLGATALGGILRASADGRPVVVGDERLGRLRRRRVADTLRADLPDGTLEVAELLGLAGTGVPLLLDVADPDAVTSAVAQAEAVAWGAGLWFCSPDAEALAAWRAAHPGLRTVWTAVLRRAPGGPERAASRVRDAGIDAIRLRHDEWTGGSVALVHRFGRLAFADGVDHARVAAALLRQGIDGLWSTFPDRLVDAAGWGAAPRGDDG